MSESNIYEQKYETTPVELFFDLIYAFALSQVTTFIMADLSWLTIIKSLILLGAIYLVWAYTSWVTTMIPTSQAISRRMLLAVMLLGFFMNLSVDCAFSGQGYIFAVLYLIIQFGRTIWSFLYSPNDEYREHYKRILIWQFITAPLWLIGILYTNILRIAIWGIAILIDLTGTWMAHPGLNRKFLSEDFYFDDDHMLERCRLFRIIALGEMVFSVGNALRDVHLNVMTVVLGCISLTEIIALWTLSFGRFVKIVAEYRKDNHNPVLTSRYAINALLFIIIGIVFITVGNKYVILHSHERLPIILVCILCGGPLLFLLAQGWYLFKIPRVKPVLYAISGIALVMSSIVGLYRQAWVYHIIIGCVLDIISFIDYKRIQSP